MRPIQPIMPATDTDADGHIQLAAVGNRGDDVAVPPGAARADVLDAALAAQRGVGPVFRLMGRTVKNALRKRKESAR